MDYEARLDLIRGLFGHKPLPQFPNRKALGQYLAAHPNIPPATRAKWKRDEWRERRKLRSDLFGLKLHEPKTRWVTMPDHREQHLSCARRRKGKHPLFKIAEQLPRKLPVLGRIQFLETA